MDKYSSETSGDLDDESFDILNWSKTISSRFKVLSKIAKDILAIFLSIVTSDSGFSTSGRLIDSFRSSLSSIAIQTLIFAPNWHRSSTIKICDTLHEIKEIEKDNMIFFIYVLLVFLFSF